MTFIQLLFYAFSAVAIGSATMVVSSANPVRGALYLVLAFFAMSGVWMLLQAEFLALILVLVYVGAVMTLFLFVVMMLSVNRVDKQEGLVRYWPFCLALTAVLAGLIITVIGPQQFGLTHYLTPELPATTNNMASLGEVLYTDYVLPFELAAVLLLTAIVAAITLTHRARKPHKAQRVSAQIAVQASERLRLINLQSEVYPRPNTPNSEI